MSLRDDLVAVLARNPRYSIEAYAFVFEALEHARQLKRSGLLPGADAPSESEVKIAGRIRPGAPRRRRRDPDRHVTGRELCLGARHLATSLYGYLAATVLARWGLESTGDLGNIVYNLIATGDMEKTPEDSRADFDDVFDFERVFRGEYSVALDDVA